MKIGIVLPHHEIGSNPDDMKAFAMGAEALGADHILLYDHVLGADRDRPGGFEGPYDKDTQFHEPLTTLSFIAAVTTPRVGVSRTDSAPAANGTGRQAGGGARHFCLAIGFGWASALAGTKSSTRRSMNRLGPEASARGGAGRAHAGALARGFTELRRQIPHRNQGKH